MHRDIWTDRQVMKEAHFEFHHYLDRDPPQVDFHQHSFYELFFFLNGDVNYSIEGRTYHLRPGDILLTSSLDIHRPEIRPGKPYERIVIWIEESFFQYLRMSGEDLASCFLDAARRDYRRIRPDHASLVRMWTLCERISQAQASRELGSHALACAHLTEFLVEIFRCYYEAGESRREDVTESRKINEVLLYLNEHIVEHLTLDAIAKKFFLSKFHLSRQFRRFTGMSIYQYVIRKRVTIARDILRTGASVTEACMECGFGDYSNFLKAFKREFGQRPSDYSQPRP